MVVLFAITHRYKSDRTFSNLFQQGDRPTHGIYKPGRFWEHTINEGAIADQACKELTR